MKQSRDEAIAEFRDKLFEKSKRYSQVFGTDAGKEVLKELVDLYIKPEVFNSDPLKMARNVGQHDLVKFIKELVELKNE